MNLCENLMLRVAAKNWLKHHHLYRFRELSIGPVNHTDRKGCGWPATDEPVMVICTLFAEIEHNPESIQLEKQKMGRFDLATKDLCCHRILFLEYRKGQGIGVGGFRFLDDKSFRDAEVYRKKNSRIHDFAVIMMFHLCIYSIVKFRLRRPISFMQNCRVRTLLVLLNER